MLGTTNLIAFIPTKDFDRAKSFYVDVLGLGFVKNDGFAMVLDANGIMIRVSKVAPEVQPLPFTILGWQVAEIESVVSALQTRGVTFERFGFFEQDALGIWAAPGGDKVAWFKDPDGNLLSVSQHVYPVTDYDSREICCPSPRSERGEGGRRPGEGTRRRTCASC
jgi:catechol 2,3-dioxygenase-like lactoylglutathione lyase family enzyme